MPLAYFYSRVSTKRQIDGLGLKRQSEARDKWIADHPMLKLAVVEDYSDLGVSGRGKNRTEGKLGLIIGGVQSGKIPQGSYLIVDSLDRISREELIDAYSLVLSIVQAGIIIVTVEDGMVYDRADKEKVMFNLLISLVVVARSSNESDVKSERGLKNWAMKRQTVADTSKPYTRMAPAWITYDDAQKRFVLNEHARTVRRIFELAASGLGTSLIIQRLAKEGIPPMNVGRRKDAKSWSRSYVAMILENRAVLGEFATGTKNQGQEDKRQLTGQVIEDYFPPVSDDIHDLWTKVASGREAKKSLTPNRIHPKVGYTNLFAGMCRCASCGTSMTVNRRVTGKGESYSYLRCPERYETKTCEGGQLYRYEPLEKIVLDHLDGILFRPNDFETVTTDTANDLAKAKIKVADLQKRLANLRELAELEGVSQYKDVIIERREELAVAESAVNELEGRSILERFGMTTEEYIKAIQKKREAASSSDEETRNAARAEIRLHLQRLIKVMMFHPDRSVTVHFEFPNSKKRFFLHIPKDGEPNLSAEYTGETLAKITWRNPPVGQAMAKRLIDGLAS